MRCSGTFGSLGFRVSVRQQSRLTRLFWLLLLAIAAMGSISAHSQPVYEFCADRSSDSTEMCFPTFEEAERWIKEETSPPTGRRFLEPVGNFKIASLLSPGTGKGLRVDYHVKRKPPGPVFDSYIGALQTPGGDFHAGCWYNDPSQPYHRFSGEYDCINNPGNCKDCPVSPGELGLLINVIGDWLSCAVTHQVLVDFSDPPDGVTPGFQGRLFEQDPDPHEAGSFKFDQARLKFIWNCSNGNTVRDYNFSRHDHFLCPEGLRAANSALSEDFPIGKVCGSTATGTITARIAPTEQCTYGNPCIPSTGAKLLPVVDFEAGALRFERTYHSLRVATNTDVLGAAWNMQAGERLSPSDDSTTPAKIFHINAQGMIEEFRRRTIHPDVYFRSINRPGHFLVLSNDEDRWVLNSPDGTYREFDRDGALKASGDRSDVTARIEYHHEELTFDADEAESRYYPEYFELVTEVRDFSGRALRFDYDFTHTATECENEQEPSNNIMACRALKIVGLVTPDEQVITYDYDIDGNLTRVDYPDGTATLYHYNEPSHIPSGGFPHHLTGVTEWSSDGTGKPIEVRRSTYQYDDLGRVVSSGPPADADPLIIAYPTAVTTLLTFPEGWTREIEYTTQEDIFRKDVRWTDTVDGDVFVSRIFTYDGHGRLKEEVLADGTVREHEYDDYDPQTPGEGDDPKLGIRTAMDIFHPDEPDDKIRTEWDRERNTNRLIETRTLNSLGIESETHFAYDSQGRLTARCQLDPDDPAASSYTCTADGSVPATGVRREVWNYCSSVDVSNDICPFEGFLRSHRPAEGLGEDVYSYYSHEDLTGCGLGGPCHRIGDMMSMTNALGHVSSNVRYDLAGRPIEVLDGNQVSTVISYDSRGRVVQSNTAGAITQYEYLPSGLLQSETRPDGNRLDFEYNDALRLVAIENSLDERIEYELDGAGNRLRQQIRDAGGVLRFDRQQDFDGKGRLLSETDANAEETSYVYDRRGNLRSVTNALSQMTAYDYDAHGRRILTTDPLSGNTQYAYDARGNLTEVIDPEGLATSYDYNAFGELVELDSPDTGLTIYAYSQSGLLVSQTDARGIKRDFSYDVLGRQIGVSYPDSSLDVTYRFDQSSTETGCQQSHPIGRMTSMSDPSGTTYYCYSALGATTEKSHADQQRDVGYIYNASGQLTRTILPSERQLLYAYDAAGQVESIDLQLSPGNVTPLVDQVIRQPFGQVSAYTLVPGHNVSRIFDQNQQITQVQAPGFSLSMPRDPVGNISSLVEGRVVESMNYDGMQRLTGITSTIGAIIEEYTYDLVGNRLTKSNASGFDNYSYPTDSHRLTSVNGQPRIYDATGNLRVDHATAITYGYGDNGRLLTASRYNEFLDEYEFVANYTHNGRGERVAKELIQTFPLAIEQFSHFVYDEAGRLLAESTVAAATPPTGPMREYVYLDDIPVALIEPDGSIRHIVADHLGTPREVLDASTGTVVWEWSIFSNPFGETSPTGSGSFQLNLRFPGQYYDWETGLHFNYFRDYEPQTGRYVQSDPIGLEGGLSTYLYTYASPLNLADPFGLDPEMDRFMDQFEGLPRTSLPDADFYCRVSGGCVDWEFREALRSAGSCALKCARNFVLGEAISAAAGEGAKRFLGRAVVGAIGRVSAAFSAEQLIRCVRERCSEDECT